jgi:chemotaxis protein methyltransferase CheR
MQLSRAVFDELRLLIHRLCGLVVGEDKTYLVRHRLGPLARAVGCRSFEEFGQKLRGPEGAALHAPIIEAITTAETSFFRDGHLFDAFRAHLLPRLVEKARGGARVRLWCAAAATGQEPYSLAMLLCDYVQANASPRLPGGKRATGAGVSEGDFSILATDISEKVLAVARAGEYSERDVARGLTPALLARHFERRDAAWVVREPARRLVEFRRLNLTEPLPDLYSFDAIFCRNLLIYFDLETRRRVCRGLHDHLIEGGWLVLGAAENLYGVSDQFEALRYRDALVYRKSARACAHSFDASALITP